jgi:hypothetical protein
VPDARCLLLHGGRRGEGDSYKSEPPTFLLPSLGPHIESLHSQDPPFGYRQTGVHQILFSNKNQNSKKRFFSVRVAELTVFQRSEVLNVDDDMYPIS